MTYAEAWKLTANTTYEQSISEKWEDEWRMADEFIRVADYDLSAGIIDAVTDYDE